MSAQKFCLLILLAVVPFILSGSYGKASGKSKRDENNRNSNYRDICVIAAGASGMYSATLAKDRELSVVVLEPTNHVGGSCFSYYFTPPSPGLPDWVEGGVEIYPDTAAAKAAGVGNWTVDTVGVVKRYAGPDSILPINFDDLSADEKTYIVDIAAGLTIGYVPPSPPTIGFEEAFAAYSEILAQYPWLADFNYPEVIPPALLVPLTQFIEENNLQALGGLFLDFIVYGQGNSSEIPALYGLTQFNQIVLRLIEVVNASFAVNNGCSSIYTGMQNYLNQGCGRNNLNVVLNATITRVIRPSGSEWGNNREGCGNSVIIGVNSYTDQSFSYECGNIIVSFPQTLTEMSYIDLDARERELFSTVSYTYYYGGILDVNGGPAAVGGGFQVNNINPEAFIDQPSFDNGAIATITRSLPYGPGSVFSVSQVPKTEAEMNVVVANNLAVIANSPNSVLNATLLGVGLHKFRPVPAISTLQREPNFYTELNDIQGYRNTYHVGSVATCASTFSVWNHALNLFNRFFSHRF